MLLHGLFGVFLHPRVERGVDAQAVAVEVVLRAVGLAVLVEPAVERIVAPGQGVGAVVFHLRIVGAFGLGGVHELAEHVAEIRAVAGVVVLLLVGDHDGDLRDGIHIVPREVVVALHLPQHVVAAGERLLGIEGRVVAGGLVDHTHQAGSLFDRKVFGILCEKGVGRGLDAVGVAAEEDLVEIHRHDLFLGIIALDLDGGDPLLELDADHLDCPSAGDAALHVLTGIEGLGQLLGDGTAAALRGVSQEDRLEEHAAQAAEVDAGMPVEAGILGGDGRVDHVAGDLVVAYIRTVLDMIGIEDLAVVGDQQGGQVAVGILDLFERRNLGEEGHQQQAQQQAGKRQGDQDPEPLGYLFLRRRFHFF